MVVSGKIVWRFDAGVFSYQTGDLVDQTGLAWQRPKRAAGKLAVKSRGCNHILSMDFFCNQSQFAQMLLFVLAVYLFLHVKKMFM